MSKEVKGRNFNYGHSGYTIVGTVSYHPLIRSLEVNMKIKKLSKHGNSYALMIDKAISEGTLLELSAPDGLKLVLTPIEDKNRKRLSEALKYEKFIFCLLVMFYKFIVIKY